MRLISTARMAGALVVVAAAFTPNAALADQVIADDLIVQGSGCLGGDCASGEVFGFDTVRLKENNLRMHFEDTSGAGFAANDWRFIFNDTGAGGSNYFALEDATGRGRSRFASMPAARPTRCASDPPATSAWAPPTRPRQPASLTAATPRPSGSSRTTA